MKPERVWRVGDRVFETYAEALKFSSTNRANLARLDLGNFIGAIISDEMPYGRAEATNADFLAEALLKRYVLKLRK